MVQYKRILTRSWLIFEFILYVKQKLTFFLLTGDVRIVKFIRACLSLRFRSKVEVADVARGPFRPHTTPTLVLLSQLFSFLDLGDVVVGYFDHIPNSQLKWRKLRCHPLVYRKICPNLLLPRSMLRIIVEKDVGHPFAQKIIFDFPPSEVWTTTGDVWVLLCPLQNLIRGHFQKSSYGCSKHPSELNVRTLSVHRAA